MFQKVQDESEGEGWISISDLMSGLMIIFLFIAILYIQPLQKIKLNVEEIVKTWSEGEAQIYSALEEEFSSDLDMWNAELDQENLVIRFKSPDVLFAVGSDQIRPDFASILSDFFPRYLQVLQPFVDENLIEEIRIEGHTSSDWGGVSSSNAYYLNMKLSQDRTRSVLKYAMNLPKSKDKLSWARPLVTANGLSSSQPIMHDNGNEDSARSRRVDFRVRTTTQNKLNQIFEQFEGADNEVE